MTGTHVYRRDDEIKTLLHGDLTIPEFALVVMRVMDDVKPMIRPLTDDLFANLAPEVRAFAFQWRRLESSGAPWGREHFWALLLLAEVASQDSPDEAQVIRAVKFTLRDPGPLGTREDDIPWPSSDHHPPTPERCVALLWQHAAEIERQCFHGGVEVLRWYLRSKRTQACWYCGQMTTTWWGFPAVYSSPRATTWRRFCGSPDCEATRAADPDADWAGYDQWLQQR